MQGEDFTMKLSEKIKRCRKNQKMTQQQFGDQLHVSRKTVSGWENDRSFPDISTLIKISDLFNISLDDLLKDSNTAIDYYQTSIAKSNLQKWKDLFIYIFLIIFTVLGYFQFLGLSKLPYHITFLGLIACLLDYLFDYPYWRKRNSSKTKAILIVMITSLVILNEFIFILTVHINSKFSIYRISGFFFGSTILNLLLCIAVYLIIFRVVNTSNKQSL